MLKITHFNYKTQLPLQKTKIMHISARICLIPTMDVHVAGGVLSMFSVCPKNIMRCSLTEINPRLRLTPTLHPCIVCVLYSIEHADVQAV